MEKLANWYATTTTPVSEKHSLDLAKESSTLEEDTQSKVNLKKKKKLNTKSKKSSSSRKTPLDANNNTNRFTQSDVFEFEDFDDKSQHENKNYVSNLEEDDHSSNESNQTSTGDEDDDEEEDDSESDKALSVLQKHNTNIENIGMFKKIQI